MPVRSSLLALALVVAASASAAQHPYPPNKSVPATPCKGGGDCDSGENVCRPTRQDRAPMGTLTFKDSGYSVTSDGGGPYVGGTSNVVAVASNAAFLGFRLPPASEKGPMRRINVDLRHPVPNGGATPRGVITDSLLRKKWGWFVALGILLIVLGFTAIGSSVFMTLVTMTFVGWIMIVGGIAQAIHAFTCKAWGGFFVDLLTGILYTVAGFMIVANPGATAIALTMLIAMMVIFGGIFRIVVAIVIPFQNWGWLLLHVAINLMLGISIWQNWPLSGLWVIGLFVGIDMIFNGWSLVMLGFVAKNLPTAERSA